MPRPLILTDDLRELPAGQPLDVGAAQTTTQALTPGQIVAGDNVDVTWENSVLRIDASGGGGGGSGAGGILPVIAGGLALKSGTVEAGDAVYLTMTGGKIRCQRASADVGGTPATAIAAQVAGNDVWFAQYGTVDAYSGLTPGGAVFLAASPGGVTQAPPWNDHQFVQRIGTAISATTISIEFGVSRQILPEGE